MDYYAEALKLHEQHHGKVSVASKVPVETADDMSVAYTPGVAQPCVEIHNDANNAYKYTAKGNLVAVVSDGSAVLGLGNIGAAAAMPVMEGKSVLFKRFGNVDAFPICLDTQDTEEIIHAVKLIAPVFGGVNLEDIGSPRCFEIEQRLEAELDIPVFHDDQHGTAVIVAAGLLNALKIVGKNIETANVVVNGAGSAGIAITKHLFNMGAKNITLCDINGIICEGDDSLSEVHKYMATITNRDKKTGSLADAMKGADVFIGVSAPNIVNEEMVKSMAENPVIFSMANPTPEIMPDVAKKAGAAVVGTGRSDFPNQINNVLAFPGIFRGALDCRASEINEEMKIAASYAIASLVGDDELNPEYILPQAFDKRIGKAVAEAVKEAAVKTGVARI